MGNNDYDQQEQTRKERQAIIEALTPEEQHQLKMIQEMLEQEGTSEQALSFKLAQAEACGLITTVPCNSFVMPDGSTMTVPDPELGREALNRAVEQIRDRILNNPVFNPYA